jgi:hypothetical protein
MTKRINSKSTRIWHFIYKCTQSSNFPLLKSSCCIFHMKYNIFSCFFVFDTSDNSNFIVNTWIIWILSWTKPEMNKDKKNMLSKEKYNNFFEFLSQNVHWQSERLSKGFLATSKSQLSRFFLSWQSSSCSYWKVNTNHWLDYTRDIYLF